MGVVSPQALHLPSGVASRRGVSMGSVLRCAGRWWLVGWSVGRGGFGALWGLADAPFVSQRLG